MTVFAINSNTPEIPVLLFFMTFKTGYCLVAPFEWKCTLIVLLQRKGEKIKAFYIVAFGAIGRNSFRGKLVFMVIGMAIGAFCRLKGIGKFTLVTGFTVVPPVVVDAPTHFLMTCEVRKRQLLFCREIEFFFVALLLLLLLLFL